jgi:2-iminoacetate synthase ThiH
LKEAGAKTAFVTGDASNADDAKRFIAKPKHSRRSRLQFITRAATSPRRS